MSIGNPSFDVFQLSDEHVEMRKVLRDLCDKEIAPYAADVDEKARYTDEALKALNSSGFSAIHIPEEYGGRVVTPSRRASSSKRSPGCVPRPR